MSIYALRVDIAKEVYNSLKDEGVARFTWSYSEEGNLKEIESKIKKFGWENLTEIEKDCWKANFMLNIKEKDYIVYINVPEYGECTVAKVTGEYFWNWEKYKSDGSHCLLIDKESIRTFNRNDKNIPSDLTRRFGLQGKYWRIYLEDKFYNLLQDIDDKKITGELASSESRLLNCINEKINPYLESICEELQHYHVGKYLEELIVKVLGEIPEIKNISRKSGISDKGGDILFDYENTDVFGNYSQKKCAIQVKSYEGIINYDQAIKDMKNIFEYDDSLDLGIIMTTATSIGEEFNEKLEELNKELLEKKKEKSVTILYGKDFARWVLKYGEKFFNR